MLLQESQKNRSSQFYKGTIPPITKSLFYNVLGFIVGIITQSIVDYSLPFVALIFTAAYSSALFVCKKNTLHLHHTIIIFSWYAFYCGGALVYAIHTNAYYIFKTTLSQEYHSYTATVKDITHNSRLNNWLLTLQCKSIQATNTQNIYECPYQLQWYLYEKPPLEVGDTITIPSLKLKKTKAVHSPHNASFGTYLLKENILESSHSKMPAFNHITTPKYSLERFFWKLKDTLYANFQNKLSQKTFSLFSAIFLGNKKNNDFMLSHNFSLWGISHYLARSGLHIVIILGFLEYIIAYIPLSIFLKQITITLFSYFYWKLSWGSISFARALCMYFLHVIALLLRRRASFLYLLILICFLMLNHNPYYIFFLDFQLTFLLTATLSWFNYQ